ncbi:MAG: hypothetical protein Q9227_001612 [Pyrenula ochraceoflavens]
MDDRSAQSVLRTKAIECYYPTNTSYGRVPRYQNADDGSQETRKTAPSLVVVSPNVENYQEASNHFVVNCSDAPATSDTELANIGTGFFDLTDQHVEFTGFFDQHMEDGLVQFPPLVSSSEDRHSASSHDQAAREQQAMSASNSSIPVAPPYTVRSFVQRSRMKTGPRGIANLILHTLKSYPQTILRHKALPPFIHPCLANSNVENGHMEPLTNCISLMHMISSGGSRRLFWKNAIAKQLAYNDIIDNTQSALSNHNLETSWKDWIHEESKRRICVIYRVVDMLIYFEPAPLCDSQTDLVLAPLPAKKQLWEAGDEFAWKTESERDSGSQIIFALASNGDLVRVEEGQLHCSDAVLLNERRTLSKSTANWEEWCSGMDGFGSLVMLAASFIV